MKRLVEGSRSGLLLSGVIRHCEGPIVLRGLKQSLGGREIASARFQRKGASQ